jgi:glycosyltransferase involved in cell wall biosynthesis
MPELEEFVATPVVRSAAVALPLSVIVAVRNEACNLPRCLQSLREVGEVYVIDSQSSDNTVEIARSFGAKVVQFHYRGGWPKKRQWAIDTLPFAYEWILLLDADESLTPELAEEIKAAILDPRDDSQDASRYDGYHIALRIYFLGRELRHSGATFHKLALFRRGQGHYECRLQEQDPSMADMEVHEHVVVEGRAGYLQSPLLHHNVSSLSHYIRKHDSYSNWEAKVWLNGSTSELTPSLTGTQAQRRRWLRRKFFALPGSPLAFFFYKYVLRLGFLDGIPGLIYCCFQGIQFFHIKAKIYELKHASEAQP